MKKSENNGDLGLKMMIFVTTPFEAEIPRFSDQSQRNSKKARFKNRGQAA